MSLLRLFIELSHLKHSRSYFNAHLNMRINAHLQVSRTKTRVENFLLLLVGLILMFSEMPALMTTLTLIAISFMVFYQRFLQQPSPRLIQLIQFDKQDWRWSVVDASLIKKTLIQEGRLLSVHHWFFVMVMHFETIEKKKTITKNWLIWRDQVDTNDWRRLIVIARFWARDSQNNKSK
jgi:hypothetical protein